MGGHRFFLALFVYLFGLVEWSYNFTNFEWLPEVARDNKDGVIHGGGLNVDSLSIPIPHSQG